MRHGPGIETKGERSRRTEWGLPSCGCSISPAQICPIDFERMRCPKCAMVLAPASCGRLEKTGSTSAAHKRDRKLRRCSRSWKAAGGCKSRYVITFRRFSPGLPISRSGAFQTLLPLCGSPGIHRLNRPGYEREVILRPKT